MLKEFIDNLIERMTPTEAKIGDEFLRLVKAANVHRKRGAKIRAKKIHGNVRNISEPDWLIVVNGKAIFIEVKVPGKSPRTGQRLRMRWWSDAGARVATCDNAEDMFTIVIEEDKKAKIENAYRERGL